MKSSNIFLPAGVGVAITGWVRAVSPPVTSGFVGLGFAILPDGGSPSWPINIAQLAQLTQDWSSVTHILPRFTVRTRVAALATARSTVSEIEWSGMRVHGF